MHSSKKKGQSFNKNEKFSKPIGQNNGGNKKNQKFSGAPQNAKQPQKKSASQFGLESAPAAKKMKFQSPANAGPKPFPKKQNEKTAQDNNKNKSPFNKQNQQGKGGGKALQFAKRKPQEQEEFESSGEEDEEFTDEEMEDEFDSELEEDSESEVPVKPGKPQVASKVGQPAKAGAKILDSVQSKSASKSDNAKPSPSPASKKETLKFDSESEEDEEMEDEEEFTDEEMEDESDDELEDEDSDNEVPAERGKAQVASKIEPKVAVAAKASVGKEGKEKAPQIATKTNGKLAPAVAKKDDESESEEDEEMEDEELEDEMDSDEEEQEEKVKPKVPLSNKKPEAAQQKADEKAKTVETTPAKAKKPVDKIEEKSEMILPTDSKFKAIVAEEERRRDERNKKCLFMRCDTFSSMTEYELKALHPDCLAVRSNMKVCWMVFASEATAEKAFGVLSKKKEIGGKPLLVDLCGSKAKNQPKKEDTDKKGSKKEKKNISELPIIANELNINNVPPATTMEQLKVVFPTAKNVKIIKNETKKFKRPIRAIISFPDAETAKKAFDKSAQTKIAGAPVDVYFSRAVKG